MLELRTYSRQELIELFKTDRLDAIKRKITRDGYEYESSGRGKTYTLTVIKLPSGENELKEYLIKTMGFKSQANFSLVRAYLINTLFVRKDPNFNSLQFNEMTEVLERQGYTTSASTMSAYTSHLISVGFLKVQSSITLCYVYDYEIGRNKYITYEEYRKEYDIWHKYYDYSKLTYGIKPRKRVGIDVSYAPWDKEFKELKRLLSPTEEELKRIKEINLWTFQPDLEQNLAKCHLSS